MDALSDKPHDLVVQWALVAVVGAAVLALGLAGFHGYFAAQHETRSALTLAYLTLQLFIFESGSIDGPIPWTLNLARFSAPIVLAYALVVGIITTFWAQLSPLMLRFKRRRHTVVCGLGRRGLHLAQDIAKRGEDVLAIDTGLEERKAPSGRIHVLLADACDRAVLGRARTWRAKRLVAITGDDGTNARIAFEAAALLDDKIVRGHKRGKTPLEVHLHASDYGLRAMLSQHANFKHIGSPHTRFNLINQYETTARLLLDEVPLDHGKLTDEHDEQYPHLVVVGCGAMGEALILQAAKIGHFINERKGKVKVTVLDREATKRGECLLGRYPQLKEICDLNFLDREAGGLGHREWLRTTISAEQKSIPTIAVCLDDERQSLSVAAILDQALLDVDRDLRILVRVSSDGGLAELLPQVTLILPQEVGSRIGPRRKRVGISRGQAIAHSASADSRSWRIECEGALLDGSEADCEPVRRLNRRRRAPEQVWPPLPPGA